MICLVLIAIFVSGCSDSQLSESIPDQSETITEYYDCEGVGQGSVISHPLENWAQIKESIESNSFDFVNNFGLIQNIYQSIYEVKLYGTNDAMARDRDKEIYSDCDEAGCRKTFCHFVNSIKDNDIKICSELPDSLKVTYVSGGKYTDYENISLNYRDMCLAYHLINEKLSDEKFCEDLEEQEGFSVKDLCNMNLALINNEPLRCLSLPDPLSVYGKSGCLSRVALMWENLEACKLIPDYHVQPVSQIRDGCYKSVESKMANK